MKTRRETKVGSMVEQDNQKGFYAVVTGGEKGGSVRLHGRRQRAEEPKKPHLADTVKGTGAKTGSAGTCQTHLTRDPCRLEVGPPRHGLP
jgi:hypothetical protein